MNGAQLGAGLDSTLLGPRLSVAKSGEPRRCGTSATSSPGTGWAAISHICSDFPALVRGWSLL